MTPRAASLGWLLAVVACNRSQLPPPVPPSPDEAELTDGAAGERPVTTCAELRCIAGTRCDESAGSGHCVAIPPAPVRACGGFAGIPCPAGQHCVDEPSDRCDPANGGRDCGGVCAPGDLDASVPTPGRRTVAPHGTGA